MPALVVLVGLVQWVITCVGCILVKISRNERGEVAQLGLLMGCKCIYLHWFSLLFCLIVFFFSRESQNYSQKYLF